MKLRFISFQHKLRLIGTTFFTILLIHSICFSQSSFNQKFGTGRDYKRLYYLNLQYIQSYIRSDTATYNHFLWADDFVHQNSGDGLLYPKKQIAVSFGKPRFDKIEYFYPENVSIQFISKDAALVMARTTYLGSGEANESYSQYNDIYVKRGGQWVCVSANVTVITKPGSPPVILNKVPPPTAFISYSPGTDQDKKVLTELNNQLIDGLIYSKKEIVERILAQDYTSIGGNGLLFKKQDVLNELKISAIPGAIEKYRLDNLSIRFVAPDLAMIHAAMIATFKDGVVTGTQTNDIFIQREGTWTCISSNTTPIKN